MLKAILFGIGLLAFGCSQSDSEGIELKRPHKSFLPENDYHLIDPNPRETSGSTTESEFNQILDTLENVYGPIVQNFGANLVVERDFSSQTINAYASQKGNVWTVSFFGGLARKVTAEGFAIVACHEMGHHLGHAVYYPDAGWDAAVEGQSDYWATAVCARKIFKELSDNNSGPEKNPCESLNDEQKNFVAKKCIGEYLYDNKTICEKSLAGGLSLGKLLADLNGEKQPSYEKLDRSRIQKTQYSHPNASCRLTSYYGGVVCNKNWPDTFAPRTIQEAKRYQCTEYLTCWLNENNL